ncbi:TetR/AcrR family transcriptional regulator [Streptomyces sp. WMMC500]|uniref:TetR/AcrR family transcriptional regulator n=1 Tax=Streptomyces sp. WMMC500 TaxID=3015154 RepID=UPI00248AAC76|nr:TetR/AcrR family transcriptional regulator [Streptomyces sp. WMMC500]WBB61266.1 TetR/AcrR family transcriptional regulator [Streptomyces sp. WMMC500]
MTHRSPRDERRARLRELGRGQILDVAEQVFAREGFHDAALREIAELAEYSVGSVYTFFPGGKDDLYRETFRRRGAEFMPQMRSILTSGGQPREQLIALADWQVGFFRAHRNFGRLVLRGGAIAPPLAEPTGDPQITKNFHEAQQLQAGLFLRGQDSGDLVSGPPAVLALMFSGLVAAYQTAELTEADAGGPPLPVEDFHALLARTFFAAE